MSIGSSNKSVSLSKRVVRFERITKIIKKKRNEIFSRRKNVHSSSLTLKKIKKDLRSSRDYEGQPSVLYPGVPVEDCDQDERSVQVASPLAVIAFLYMRGMLATAAPYWRTSLRNRTRKGFYSRTGKTDRQRKTCNHK